MLTTIAAAAGDFGSPTCRLSDLVDGRGFEPVDSLSIAARDFLAASEGLATESWVSVRSLGMAPRHLSEVPQSLGRPDADPSVGGSRAPGVRIAAASGGRVETEDSMVSHSRGECALAEDMALGFQHFIIFGDDRRHWRPTEAAIGPSFAIAAGRRTAFVLDTSD